MSSAGLDDRFYADLDARLGPSDERLLAQYPGESGRRQPVHTVYVPADRYAADTATVWGAEALAMMDEFAPDADVLADLVGIRVELAAEVRPLVAAKLAREPIEDLRIDFEDGYGPHPDAEEDADVERAAAELAASVRAGTAPPFVGLRFKSLEPATRRRGLRSLDLFLGPAGQRGRAAGRVRHHAAQGDPRRAGAGVRGRVRRAGRRARPARAAAGLRDPDRDPAGRPVRRPVPPRSRP